MVVIEMMIVVHVSTAKTRRNLVDQGPGSRLVSLGNVRVYTCTVFNRGVLNCCNGM